MGETFGEHETQEGKYYYIVQLDVPLKPGQQTVYDTAVQALLTRAVPAMKETGSLMGVGTAVEAGHSYATHRVWFEFSTFQGVGALLANQDYQSFISTGSNN